MAGGVVQQKSGEAAPALLAGGRAPSRASSAAAPARLVSCVLGLCALLTHWLGRPDHRWLTQLLVLLYCVALPLGW